MRNIRRIREKFEFSLDGRQVSLLFFLIILLIGLSFSIGVMYGKGLRKIEKPEISVKEEQPPAVVVEPAQPAPESQPGSVVKEESSGKEYTFYDALTKETPPPGIEGGTKEQSGVVIPPPEEKKPVEEKVMPEQKTPEAPPVSSEVSAMSKGEYAIQVVAYNDREKARSMVKKLKSRGFNAFVEEGRAGGKRVFRVKIGYYKTRDDAEKAVKELKKKEGITGFITK